MAVVSFVQSHDDESKMMQLGWVTDRQILNILTNRAKSLLILIGNGANMVRVLNSHQSSQYKFMNHNRFRKFKLFVQYLWNNNLIYDWEAIRESN